MNFTIGKLNVELVESDQTWMPTEFGITLAEVIVKHAKDAGKKALELGTGSGIQCTVLGKLGYHVTGLDLNPAALSATYGSWIQSGLPTEQLELRQSNFFGSLNGVHGGVFDLVVCNPPTFPGSVKKKQTRNDWEYAGADGRAMLDAVLTGAGHYLRPGGMLLTIATSRQNWKLTQTMLDKHWGRNNWRAARVLELPLAEHYEEFVPIWLEQQAQDGEPRIYSNGDDGYKQVLYFVKAVKAVK